MSGRARLFALVAQREAMARAALGPALRQAASDQQTARAMVARLQHLIAEIGPGTGVHSVDVLQNRGLLLARLLSECAAQEDRARLAQDRAAHLRAQLVAHDQRHRSSAEAARVAHLAEVAQAEERREASLAPARVR